MSFWHAYMGIEGGGTAVTSHVITIEGQCLVADSEGVKMDSRRAVRATLTPGDAAVVYVFEETEVS